VRVKPGVYRIAVPRDSAVITIRGSDVRVDLRGVTLEGASLTADPDEGEGIAVRIDGGARVHVEGLRARGYRVGILARGTRGLVLRGNDLSHGWKPRLFSLVEHESLNDWLSFHRNEQGEWLRFGAGIYLDSAIGGAVERNTVRQGMNGLLMTRSDSVRITGNDFSFNSGLGIGMYRASHNTIVENRLDYDVRGYSHGFYRRGQDSAGLLMFEQCSGNTVAQNSVTHGGDGLFLWAGQHTMDTGQGGSNDNRFIYNDFSWAPTNGIEATFSRNTFTGNRVVGNDHGVWGGYSFDSWIVGNCFARNRIGVAIEHGQANTIAWNRFAGDSTGVRLWANPIEPGDWGYPKHRDTRSRDYVLRDNAMTGVPKPFDVSNTTVARGAPEPSGTHDDPRCVGLPPIPDSVARSLGSTGRRMGIWPRSADADRDRSAIIVDEWGPFDWKSPKLWPVDSTRAVPLRLRVVGPAGRWRVTSLRGVRAISARAGSVGDTIAVTPHADSTGDWSVMLAYTGGETVSPRGVRTAAGVPVPFGYARWEPVQRWSARVVAWTDSGSHPVRHPDAFAAALRGTPLVERTFPRLDFMWYRPTIAGIPATNWAMEATATLDLPSGRYTLRTLSDDAVRVWVDDALVVDHWTPHETAPAYATIDGGRRRVRVVYVQAGGWSELRLDVLRGEVRRSTGSAGPH
jgi:parallel beta-helix repeat protein